MSLIMYLVFLSIVISGIIQARALIIVFRNNDLENNPSSSEKIKRMKNQASLFVVLGIIIFFFSLITG